MGILEYLSPDPHPDNSTPLSCAPFYTVNIQEDTSKWWSTKRKFDHLKSFLMKLNVRVYKSVKSSLLLKNQLLSFYKAFSLDLNRDDGGHDSINNFEFLCNSMKSLISISNFSIIVMKDVKWYENFKSVQMGHHSSYLFKIFYRNSLVFYTDYLLSTLGSTMSLSAWQNKIDHMV